MISSDILFCMPQALCFLALSCLCETPIACYLLVYFLPVYCCACVQTIQPILPLHTVLHGHLFSPPTSNANEYTSAIMPVPKILQLTQKIYPPLPPFASMLMYAESSNYSINWVLSPMDYMILVLKFVFFTY